MGGFLSKVSTLCEPSTSGESLPQPSISGESLPQPSTSGESLPQSSISGESLPQPSTSGESLPQPSISGESLPQSSISGESLPQPSTSGQSLPQPSASGEVLAQPSTAGGSYLQYIRKSKRRRYLIQLDAYSIQLSTRMPETVAATAQEYLNLATSESRKAELESKYVQFNHKQCEYLVNNLKLSIDSVQDVVRFHSPQQILECLGSLKLLVRLAIDIKSFIDECSKEKWIQAATMFMDASMHVASLSYYLKACTALLCKQSNGTLQQTLVNICKVLDSCENENARQDQDSLLKKLQRGFDEGSILNTPEDKELAHKLIGRLRTALDGPSASPQFLQNWRVDLDHVELKRGTFLGSGAAATVYDSKCMGGEVAEKLFEGKGYDRKFVGIVEGEVEHTVRLSHPNIVQILHYAVDERWCSMVVEKMDGDLDSLIRNRLHGEASGTIPFCIDEALDVMLQTAEGMHYIHEKKMVHRDLKPSNILFKYVENDPPIGGQLTIKVADFGESKRRESTITMSTQAYNIGTTRYMAPEVIRMGQRKGADTMQNNTFGSKAYKYPFKSDIYSYAMVCYMLLTGEEPFPNAHGNEVKNKVLAKERPELLPNQCPNMLKALIERCWHPDPLERPCFGQICEELRLIKITRDSDWASDAYQVLVQVNHRQCEYLVQKLKVAIQSAHIYFGLKQGSESLGILEFLIRLAEDVEIFIHNCCKDKWIVACVMLPNTFEHVASITYKLELCTQLCGSSPTTESIESLGERVQHDQIALMERLNSDITSANDFELASMLRRRLEAASPVLARNAESSNCDAWRVDSTEWTTVSLLGRGSFATVFKGEWRGEHVTVKSFEYPSFEYPEEFSRKEVSMHASMCHPNIAQFYCWAATSEHFSIVMELMDEDLQSLMQRKLRDYKTPFTIMQSIDIALQISEGVKYMHQQHMVHRDLKSSNILVKSMKITTVDIEVVYAKVSDFGLSKRNYNNSTFSEQTLNVGTRLWMAPESIRMGHRDDEELFQEGRKFYPFKKDVYSFGILCSEILTGDMPFSGLNVREFQKRVLEGDRPQLPNQCPDMLKALIERCWDPKPENRPSFVEISEELYRLQCLYLREPMEPMDQTMDTAEELEALQEDLEELKGEVGLSNMCIPYASLSASREHLGRGGSYTTVYKVNLEGDDVAQKEFTSKKKEQFKRELQIYGRLGSHPNIIRLICYSMHTRFSSIVMELMEEDLRVFIRRRFLQDPFSMAEAIDIMLQIAKGMQHIHGKDIVHRDLKSENILIKRGSNGKWLAKVADFGQSMQLQDPCYEKFSMVGTIRWMAPEVMSLEEYDGDFDGDYTSSRIALYKTDIYSFGMVCYEIIAGRVPFFNIYDKSLYEELREVIKQVKQDKRPPLPEKCHPKLISLIQSCWDKDASKRPTFVTIVQQLSGIQQLSLYY